MFDRVLNTLMVWTSRNFPFNVLYINRTKTLLNKTAEHRRLPKFHNFRGKESLAQGKSPNIKRTLSSRTSPVRLLLKLIYWNKSIESINIFITTNEYQEQSQTMIEKFQDVRRKCDFKKVDISLWPECFLESCLDIVTTYSFCFGTSSEKSPWAKIYGMEYCLNNSIFT